MLGVIFRAAAKFLPKSLSNGFAQSAKHAAKAAPVQQGIKSSVLNNAVLTKAKIGLVVGVGIGGLVMAEYASDHALSKKTPGLLVDIADQVKKVSPQLAEQIKEHGLAAISTYSDITDTTRDAAVNIAAGVLDEKGHHDYATGLRVGNAITQLSLIIDVADANEGERTKTFIDKVLKKSEVSKEQLENYFLKHPTETKIIQEKLQIDLASSFPKLAEQQAQISNSSSMLGAFGTASITKFVTDFIEEVMQKLSNFIEDWTGFKLISQTPDDTNAIPATEMRRGRDHKLPNNPEPAFDMG